jgi:hypothetical protein
LLGKSLKTGILLERAWQMEFYKAVYQVTPLSFSISPDVGKVFGDSGFIDFTVHSPNMDIFWGVELLREASDLEKHLNRFTYGGGYDTMVQAFSDYCVVDFRRHVIENLNDLKLSEKLIIVMYDSNFENVVAYYTNPNGTIHQEKIR